LGIVLAHADNWSIDVENEQWHYVAELDLVEHEVLDNYSKLIDGGVLDDLFVDYVRAYVGSADDGLGDFEIFYFGPGYRQLIYPFFFL
jgi:hypothetical protein